ncbi:MAG: class I tRNA ligase family protein [Patescibacteria group bacterium]
MSTDNPVPQTTKSKVAETEEKILEYWDANQIFKKTLEKESPKGDFVFYDGPPFATGLPHYGHVIPSTVKDVIPRYKTMRGYRVRRRWGWDCHGLPVENLIEKELNLASKKDILDYGIGKFNAKAQESVMRYADDWRKIIPRLGRWVDMDNDYRTMDASYTESVWWAFSQLHKKGLVYEGFKSMSLCPRCETTLSNFEVSQGYKDITDISVYVKFELKEEKGTYLIAWTTTPWTLPGNVALAVNTHIEYQKIQIAETKYIVAVARLGAIKEEYKKLEAIHGKDLVGKEYTPVFDYYSSDKKLKNQENGWKVYGADFVTTESGTGIVHIAPAFGADDYELSLAENLPFVQHVATDGTFKSEVKDFAGQHVKPKDSVEEKDAHQKGDVEIIKYLAHSGKLFAKEKIIHSYPHCWRCDTPLLNYASSSWFVKVTQFKDKLVKENKKVAWIPPEIGEGRFGNWLEGARDWAISRSRFWGAPLPVWKDEKTGEQIVMGSVDDLKKYSKPKNTYYIVRHGEALNNTKSIISSKKENPHPLTTLGRKQADEAGTWLKDKKIDLIIASPFVRTQETAKIIAEKLGSKLDVLTDDRITEINLGVHDGEDFQTFIKKFEYVNRFVMPIEGGENYRDIKRRMGAFLYSLEEKYADKNILIVSHDSPLFLLEAAACGLNEKDSIALRGTEDHFLKNALPKKLDFHPLPHNENYELELHRPFIDDLKLVQENGNKLIRVPEVFDCWFESGSMPFGEAHYPFSKEEFNPKPGPFSKILGKTRGYPADFIAEGLDQTRGWFYSMIVLGVALFGRSPYKSVIVNGLLLAEDGQKMSKSKKNYPELMPTVDKYGADALRYYLMASPVVHAQDFCFSEKGVDEVVKKHIGRLNNVVSFYEMYAVGIPKEVISKNILDLWILARLAEVGIEVTKNLDAYELDKATRPFADFIDDLSTWYLRRSRDRFKGDDEVDKLAALSTTRTVLLGLATLIAPVMPFLAEDMYRRLKGEKESVHLEDWPEFKKPDASLVKDMQETRKIASLGLEARMKAKINVRQPLAKLTMNTALKADFLDLIEDEVNVKEVALDKKAPEGVVLDTALTPALVEEGQVRELIRMIQDLRKESGLTIHDKATLTLEASPETRAIVEKNKEEISRITSLKDVVIKEGTETKLSLEK